ncbi:MAG: site-2 protease family protein [Helicobacteraceae bacterium]|jgi:Zn-dependent protease|nr:site-2 protease family protein [Helicobacteraceae bacterium]
MSSFDFDPIGVALKVAALLIAVIGHEIMHGLAALYYGDTTAKESGRLSLNPIAHVDPIGTIALPLMLLLSGSPFLFGWAKPVPIDVHRVLERGHIAMVVVSLAGVVFNLLLALIAAQLITFDDPSVLDRFLIYLVLWNVVLAVFNLLPIPPLDGANAISHLSAAFGIYAIGSFFNKIGMWGMVILVVILMTDLKLPIFLAMDSIMKLMFNI